MLDKDCNSLSLLKAAAGVELRLTFKSTKFSYEERNIIVSCRGGAPGSPLSPGTDSS